MRAMSWTRCAVSKKLERPLRQLSREHGSSQAHPGTNLSGDISLPVTGQQRKSCLQLGVQALVTHPGDRPPAGGSHGASVHSPHLVQGLAAGGLAHDQACGLAHQRHVAVVVRRHLVIRPMQAVDGDAALQQLVEL